jgi:phosphoglycerate dehydrogenase-like enzyme
MSLPGTSARPLTVLVLGSPEDHSLSRLHQLPGVRAGIGRDADAIAEALGAQGVLLEEAEVLLVAGGGKHKLADLLSRAPRLAWVHSRAAGIDHLLSPALLAAPVILTNGSGAFSDSLAEFALAGILHFAKDVPRLQRAQAAQLWEQFEPRLLKGATLGLVGYGSIGRAVARRARALDMNVIAVRRRQDGDDDGLGVRFLKGPGGLLDLMRTSDAVVVVSALTAETRGLVSREALAALQPHAVLVNVARGALVDEPALIDALREHRLRGAALDVFVEEPLPKGHPLYALDNVLLSPHCADNVPGWLEGAVDVFLDNLERFRRGQPLRNRVDPARGY